MNNGYLLHETGEVITVGARVSRTVIDVAKKNTDNRLLGLSRLQRQILGIACTVRASGGRGPDFVVQLGVYAIYRLAPNIADQTYHYRHTKQYANAQAAISRALSRLVRRGLLARSEAGPTWSPGFMLSAEDLPIEPVHVPELDPALRYFALRDAKMNWARDEGGNWQGYTFKPWPPGLELNDPRTPPYWRLGRSYGVARAHDDLYTLQAVAQGRAEVCHVKQRRSSK